MKKKMILVFLFVFGLLASSYAYTQQDEFHGRPDCCCCCCCRPCPRRLHSTDLEAQVKCHSLRMT